MAIEVIASTLTLEQWYGFCAGNILKYKLRTGEKDDAQQEINKSRNYKKLYEQHRGLCRD